MANLSNSKVCIIIVAAGKEQYFQSCLDSVKNQTHPNIKIIVIDNSLDNDLSRKFCASCLDVKFYAAGENLSYCRALNKGIDLCEGEFILCLNDDVILEKDFIEEALKGFKVNEKIGMVSGKILRGDKKTIDSAGLFLGVCRTAKERGYGVIDRGQFGKERYIFGVNGAVAFYRKSMLEQLKIDSECFDSDFGFFYEDLDIAWRAHNFGWKGFFTPAAVAYHTRGATARGERGLNKRFARRFLNDDLHFDLVKNRYLGIIKNESVSGLLLHLVFILLYDIFVWGFILFFRTRLLKKIPVLLSFMAVAFKKRMLLEKKKKQGVFNLTVPVAIQFWA